MSLGHRVLLGLLFALYPLTACSTGSDVTSGISSPGDDGGQADAVGGSGSGSTASGGSSTGSGGTSSGSGSSGSGVDGGGSSGAESGAGGDAGGPTGPVWVNLDTSRTVPSNFSGVIFGIRVDPRNADVVYVASSNGGLWKSVDYTSANRHWTPMTDAIGQLILGAIDLDPQNPDIVYVGLKDHIQDPAHIHKGVIKSTDGGKTWGPPVVATGTYPAAAGGATVTANEVWDLRVDPTNSSVVLIATEVGMFRSVDAGASFQLVDLPNANPTDVQENLWTVAYVGSAGGQSVWAASGQCSSGCQGDLWRSADSGATWSSVRAAGNLPIPTGDLQRMSLAAGPTADPTQTVVYVEANANGPTQLYRSLDGGTTYSMISGALVGPDTGCAMTSDIMGGQAWYNQAVVVDPTDGNHVLFGGEGCHARSLDGMSAQPTFSQAKNAGNGNIHPDWHAAFISNIGGVLRVYSGNDGGLRSSTNIFTVPVGSEDQIVWRNDNAGLETPLTNYVGSGDPKTNTAEVVVSGLQDNGVVLGVSQGTTSSFHSTQGGDGSGVAVNAGTAGMFFWGGIPGLGWLWCSGSSPTACENVWSMGVQQNFPAGDTLGNIRLSPVLTEPSGGTFLTLTNHNVWRTDAQGTITWISGTLCDPSGTACTSGSFPYTTFDVQASPTVPGFYGVTFDYQAHLAAVTIDGDSPSPHWIVSQPIPSGDQVASIALPPATPPGKKPGDVYAVAMSRTGPLPNGHVFLTQDHGQSWLPIAGNGSGADLPNVNTYVVRYDPTDMSDNTLYVATDVGIFQTVDGGATWKPFGTGLPQAVFVSDLYVASDASFLRISTTGRGLWELHTR